jgi:SNF family Na+-dependent transporter
MRLRGETTRRHARVQSIVQSLASHVPTAIIVLTLSLVTLAAPSLGVRFAIAESRPVIMSAVYVLAYVIVIEMMIDYNRPS